MFSLGAFPGAQQGQADFAAVVEIRVESDRASTGGAEIDIWRRVWVLGGEEEVKDETASTVGCILGSGISKSIQNTGNEK